MAEVVARMTPDEFDFTVHIGFDKRLELTVEFKHPHGVAGYTRLLDFGNEGHNRVFELFEALLMVVIEGIHGRTACYRQVRQVLVIACDGGVLVFGEKRKVVPTTFIVTFVELDDIAGLRVVETGFELGRIAHDDGTVKQNVLRFGIFVKIDGFVVGILKVEAHLELLGFVATTDYQCDCQDCEECFFHNA
jgi:hypothetical protein